MFASFRQREPIYKAAEAGTPLLGLMLRRVSGHSYGKYNNQKGAQNSRQKKPSRVANEVTHE
jgi:hypothetical protein